MAKALIGKAANIKQACTARFAPTAQAFHRRGASMTWPQSVNMDGTPEVMEREVWCMTSLKEERTKVTQAILA
jgi:hypothetical protein